jgi:hypothetical protein
MRKSDATASIRQVTHRLGRRSRGVITSTATASWRRGFEDTDETMSDATQNIINSLQQQQHTRMAKLDVLQRDA